MLALQLTGRFLATWCCLLCVPTSNLQQAWRCCRQQMPVGAAPDCAAVLCPHKQKVLDDIDARWRDEEGTFAGKHLPPARAAVLD